MLLLLWGEKKEIRKGLQTVFRHNCSRICLYSLWVMFQHVTWFKRTNQKPLLAQRSSDVRPNAHLWLHTYFTFVKGGSREAVWCGGSCEEWLTNVSPFSETYLLMAFFRYCCSHRISGFTHTSLFVFSLALMGGKNRRDISPRRASSADETTWAESGESDFLTLPSQFDREGGAKSYKSAWNWVIYGTGQGWVMCLCAHW